MSKKQMGFTLIEIVMVLVLLGILSAVAVPKYFDLREQAEQRALDATAAELQSRIMAHFAQNLMSDTKPTCSDAVKDAISKTNGAQKDFETVNGWSLNSIKGENGTSEVAPGTTGKAKAIFTKTGKANQSRDLVLPTCNDPVQTQTQTPGNSN